MASELVCDTNLEVSSPLEEDEFGGRVALTVATHSAEEESEPLDPLGANLASKVSLSISSSDSEAQEETVPWRLIQGIPSSDEAHPDSAPS